MEMKIANPAAAMMQGMQYGQQVQGMRNQNALRQLYQDQGAQIAAGDEQALNSLAQYDPQMAMQMRRQGAADQRAEQRFQMDKQSFGMGMQLDEARLTHLREQGRRDAEVHALRLSEAERQRAAREIDSALRPAAVAYRQGPEAFEGWKQQNIERIQGAGIDPNQVTYENFVVWAAGLTGAKDALLQGMELADASGLGPSQPDYQNVDGNIVDMKDPGAGVVEVPGMRPGTSAAESEIGRMTSIGIPYDVAVRINSGVYRELRDPATGEVVVVDMASQQPVMRLDQQGNVVAGTNSAAPSNQEARNRASQSNDSVELSFGSEVPQGGDTAFGLRGAAGTAINTAGDMLGLGQAFPELAEHRNFFRNFEEELSVGFAQGYGRQPAQALMERLRRLSPNVENIFEGPEQAKGELRASRRRFEREKAALEEKVQDRMKVQERNEIRAQISGIDSLLGTMDEALARLGGVPDQQDGSGGTTSSGISWSIEQ